MNVLGIGTGELLLILLIVLLVMGPERLPELARQVGKMVRVLNRFTRTWREISTEITRQMNLEDVANASPKPKPAPAPPTPTPDQPDNKIAPPGLLHSTVPPPKDEVPSPTPPLEPAVETLPVSDDLTPVNPSNPSVPVRSNPTEPIHE